MGGTGGAGAEGGDDDDEVPPEVVEVVEKAKDELDRSVVFECRGKLSRLGDERDNEGKRTGKQEWKEMGPGHFQVQEAAVVTLVLVAVRI